MLIGLVASGAPLPYTAGAAVPLVWAGVESVRSLSAFSASKRAGAHAASVPRRMVVSTVVSLMLVCVLTVTVLLPYVVYPVAKSRQDCLVGANTAIAAADCDSRFYGGLTSLLDGLSAPGSP
jgi:hypothetical protein